MMSESSADYDEFPLPGGRVIRVPRPTPAQQEERERRRREEAERERLENIDRFIRASGMPNRYWNADLKFEPVNPSHGRARDALLALVEQPGMLALLGPRGVGKTYLACALARKFIEARRLAIYVRTLDVFLRLRATFKKESPESERAVVQELVSPPLLILDEAGVRGGSDWEGNVLADLIDRRYGAMKATIFIANQRPQKFLASVGDSIASRLAETGSIVNCAWPSFREGRT